VPCIYVDSYVIAYLQASIRHDVTAIMSLNDFIVWLQHVNIEQVYSDMSCLWLWII
jgi:hypothetical protein